MRRIMIASDFPTVLASGKEIMNDLGFSVIEAVSVLDALSQCEALLPEIVIVDAALPDALMLISNIRLMSPGQIRADLLL